MNKRERYLDIAKGLGILSIVLLHFLAVDCLSSTRIFIGLYMISIFYVISGWIDALREKDIPINEMLAKRWKQLGIPYVWWTTVIILFDVVLCLLGFMEIQILMQEVYKFFVLRGIGTLWFLPALFGGELIWYFIKKQNKKWLTISSILLVLFYNSLYYHFFGDKTDILNRIIEAPFHTIDNILNAYLFIAGGYALCSLFKCYETLFKPKVWGLIGFIICIGMYWWTFYVHIPFIGYKIVSLLAPFGFILLLRPIQECGLLNYLNYWGRHSLGLMVTHYSLLLPICVIIQNHISHSENLRLQGWSSLLYLIPVMIVEYYLVSFVEKRYPQLLGK